jgi:hypothetical protein
VRGACPGQGDLRAVQPWRGVAPAFLRDRAARVRSALFPASYPESLILRVQVRPNVMARVANRPSITAESVTRKYWGGVDVDHERVRIGGGRLAPEPRGEPAGSIASTDRRLANFRFGMFQCQDPRPRRSVARAGTINERLATGRDELEAVVARLGIPAGRLYADVRRAITRLTGSWAYRRLLYSSLSRLAGVRVAIGRSRITEHG